MTTDDRALLLAKAHTLKNLSNDSLMIELIDIVKAILNDSITKDEFGFKRTVEQSDGTDNTKE